MRERPILFSSPMVRALLAGSKTQTRRAIKPQPVDRDRIVRNFANTGWEIGRSRDSENAWRDLPCPYGVPGDRLWVRETWCSPEEGIAGFAADGWCGAKLGDGNGGTVWMQHGYILEAPGYSKGFREPARTWGLTKYGGKWRPSIHMPRWASRLLLEITEVRAQRLMEISEVDAIDEGALTLDDDFIVEHFAEYSSTLAAHFNSDSRSRPPIGPTPRERFRALWNSINGAGAWDLNPYVWAVSFRRIEAPA